MTSISVTGRTWHGEPAGGLSLSIKPEQLLLLGKYCGKGSLQLTRCHLHCNKYDQACKITLCCFGTHPLPSCKVIVHA